MYSIRLSDGSFSVIETSEELEPGETISGNLDTLGFEFFRSVDSGLKFDCIVQNIHCSEILARQRCFLR
jgi:hypothetical protein